MNGREARQPQDVSAPLPRVATARLLGLTGLLFLAAMTLPSFLCPFRVGWRRSAELVAAEDRLALLQAEMRRLREELRYRETEESQALEALRQFELGPPGGRAVELVPKSAAPRPPPPPTFAERAARCREDARLGLYRQWRIAARYLLDKRLPPPVPPPGSTGRA